jgi:hypothetical protein
MMTNAERERERVGDVRLGLTTEFMLLAVRRVGNVMSSSPSTRWLFGWESPTILF